MRWSYRTVHFELKKEGLLGSAFIDESEIEETLNEYGAAGWELVSMLETRDGVIAVFKQPMNLDYAESVQQSAAPPEQEKVVPPIQYAREAEPRQVELPVGKKERKPVDKECIEEEINQPELPEQEEGQDAGIGSIRIE